MSWRVWAGGFEGAGAGPYEGLEGRGGFWDIRVSGVFLLAGGNGEWGMVDEGV